MVRIAGISTFALLAAMSTSAFAAPCTDPAAVVVSEDHRSATIIPDNMFATPGAPASCTQTGVDVPIPAGQYGVYKVEGRGFVFQSDGDKTTYTVTVDGKTKQATVTDSYADDKTFTRYFGVGDDGSPTFDSKYTVKVTGDPASGSSLDSVDVLANYTSRSSVEDSLTQIGAEETAAVTHLGASAGLLTGSNDRLEGDNEIGVFGGAGSYMFGVTGRYNLGEGFSVLGGGSMLSQSAGGATVSGPLGSFAVRYVEPANVNAFRLYGEAGVNLASLSTTFSRHYDDATDNGVTQSSTDAATYASVYGRGGVVITPDDSNEIVLSATVEESLLGVAGHSESLSDANMFPATFADRNGNFTTVKGTAAWTTDITPELDFTATGSIGGIFAHSGVTADVAFIGDVSGTPQSALFAEGGLRLGWKVTDMAKVDGFVNASTGTNGIGTHVLGGVGAHLSF